MNTEKASTAIKDLRTIMRGIQKAVGANQGLNEVQVRILMRELLQVYSQLMAAFGETRPNEKARPS